MTITLDIGTIAVWLLTLSGAGVGAYVAIREDIARLTERIAAHLDNHRVTGQ